MKKYRIIKGKLNLYRIQALKDFGGVKKGDLGGWIEGEWNLSHEGDCWIYKNGHVIDEARVERNARIMDSAVIMDNAYVTDNACVYGRTKIGYNAIIKGNSKIYGRACIDDDAIIDGNAKIGGKSIIRGSAVINGNIIIEDNITIKENVYLSGDVNIFSEKDLQILNWHPLYPIILTKNPRPLFHCGRFSGTREEFLRFLGLNLTII